MNGYQAPATCPRCGSAAAVHSIQELADLARAQLGKLQPGFPGPQQQQPDWDSQAQLGPMMGPGQQGPMMGPGVPPPGRGRRGLRGAFGGGGMRPAGPPPGTSPSSGADQYLSPDQELADVALGEAARFIGRAIGRKVQRTYTGQVQPALAGRAETMLRTQIEIADRHPDVRACLNDGVVFLAGGQRVAPMPDLSTLTVEQADALVATLRSG